MLWKVFRVTIVVAAVLVAWSLVPGASNQACAQGQQPAPAYGYYVQPGGTGGVGAQMYLCPLPTPPLVGHTYYTYPPLMPHEFLYPHCRIYWRQHSHGGWTRTMVCWQ